MCAIALSPSLPPSPAVEACGRAGQWQKALWLLAEVRDKRLRPDAFTLNAVMDALGRCVDFYGSGVWVGGGGERAISF